MQIDDGKLDMEHSLNESEEKNENEKMVSDFTKFITGVHDDRYIFVTGGAGRG